MSDQIKDATDKVKDTAEGATEPISGIKGAFGNAVNEVIAPAVQQMSNQAAQQAVDFAKAQGPKLFQEQVLPQLLKSVGADKPADLGKAGIGKVGEMLSDSGGISGVAGKVMSKLGGGKGGGTATGYGQKRRMPVQQDLFVSVNVEDAYRGWTEYKRWTEFMHRANMVDPDEGDDEFRLKVTEKMWLFKRPFTASVVSQVPFEHIRWSSTEGTKHVGVIAFHPLGDRLTLISVNLDHAPSGLVEKTARGNRFVKRAVRADLHRFKGWIEHKSDDEIEEIEGWLGTIEDGKIVKSHEDQLDEQDDEQPDDEQPEDEQEDNTDDDEEVEEDDDEEVEEPEEEEEAAEEEEPEPAAAIKRTTKRSAARRRSSK